MHFIAYNSHEVLTPDGTGNLRINWTFDLTHPIIVEAIMYGKYTIEITAKGYNGPIPSIATFYPNGRVKLIRHLEP
jgi:hypothetical protein